MFPNEARPGHRVAFDAFMIGAVTNNLVPGRAGDVLRAAVIGRHLQSVGMSGAIATVILEKILDVAVVLLLFGLSISYLLVRYTDIMLLLVDWHLFSSHFLRSPQSII